MSAELMRVLLISWEYPPYVVGGMGKHVAELVPVLSGLPALEGQLSVDVLTTRYAGGLYEEVCSPFLTVYRVDAPPLDPLDHYNSVVASNQSLIQRAEQLAQCHAYDLIHIHDWLVAKVGIVLKHRWKAPLVTTIHATERGRHQGHLPSETSAQIDRMEWLCSFEAWRVIACSDFMRQELQNYFGLPADKIVVIPNGIDLDRAEHCAEEKRAALRQRYAPQGEHLLLYVGRIVYEKGLHILIRAMPRLLAAYPQTRLLVAGKNGERYWPLAYELNVERSIDFLGYISDEERDCLYTLVDAAIFPSLYEPFGIVALEAMAAGASVIVSSVGGLAEVVRHLENGLTVLPNDPLSIAWAVDQLFSDPVAADRRRRQARQDVVERYSWRQIANQTVAFYHEIVHERSQTDW
ncbi:MAG: glycosyltransferase family 4 protein [Caldilinea sp.]